MSIGKSVTAQNTAQLFLHRTRRIQFCWCGITAVGRNPLCRRRWIMRLLKTAGQLELDLNVVEPGSTVLIAACRLLAHARDAWQVFEHEQLQLERVDCHAFIYSAAVGRSTHEAEGGRKNFGDFGR